MGGDWTTGKEYVGLLKITKRVISISRVVFAGRSRVASFAMRPKMVSSPSATQTPRPLPEVQRVLIERKHKFSTKWVEKRKGKEKKANPWRAMLRAW